LFEFTTFGSFVKLVDVVIARISLCLLETIESARASNAVPSMPSNSSSEGDTDWLHVDDHCRGIYSVLMNGRSGEAYNIGGGRELSNNEITSLILEAMDADESSIEYVEDRKGHDLRYSVDWTKINRELGYEPKIKFEDGLKETIQWYRDNEAWWKPLKNR
jgi:dTDP-glucose 4,6-dehydratase